MSLVPLVALVALVALVHLLLVPAPAAARSRPGGPALAQRPGSRARPAARVAALSLALIL